MMSRAPQHRRFAAAAGFLVWGAAAAVAHAQKVGGADEREAPEVRSLTITGVTAVDPDELRRSIATEASGCKSLVVKPFCLFTHSHYFYDRRYLDRTEFKRDVLRIRVFYWRRGYRDARVDTVVAPEPQDPQEVHVTFTVSEGPPTLVQDVRVVRTDSVLRADQARALVPLDSGAPLNLFKLDSGVVQLRNALWDRGYADAVIDTAVAVDTAARTARVTITVDPRWIAHIGSVSVTGNRKVSTRTIRTSLSLRPGDVFRRSDLLTNQRRLFESDLFRRASITVATPGDSAAARRAAGDTVGDTVGAGPRDGGAASGAAVDSIKPVVIDVTEAPLRAVRTSVGFNTVDFVQVDARYTRYNFFGGARRLELSAAVGNLLASTLNGRGVFHSVGAGPGQDTSLFLKPTWQASADFLQPWFLSPRNSIGLGVFGHRRSVPAVVIDRGYGASATFTREVVARVPASVNYRFEQTRVEAGDVYFCVNFGVCEPATIGALRSNQRLNPLLLTVNVNRANDPLEPTSGYQGRLDLEHASSVTLSDFRYNRAFVDAAAYRGLGGGKVLAAHARLGWVRPLASTEQAVGAGATGSMQTILHPRVRFYAGGSRSVRGVGENQLGPRVLTVAPVKLDSAGCDTRTLAGLLACDPTHPPKPDRLTDNDFTVRPLGGSRLLEGSVEFRFPLLTKLNLGGAAFIDAGYVGSGSLADAPSNAVVTPGVGIRYYSPVGPIRVDLGLNPARAEPLPVVTQLDRPNAPPQIVQLGKTRVYDPTGTKSGIAGFLTRLTLHLSIGEAY